MRVEEVAAQVKAEWGTHQTLLPEMSLPGIKVPIEKLLPQILGRLGKDSSSERRCKGAFVQHEFGVMPSVLVQFLYATYTGQGKIVYECRVVSVVRYSYAFWNYSLFKKYLTPYHLRKQLFVCF